MRSEAARRTRKELTFIPVAKCRTRRRRRSIDWSIDIVGETTGASNTPGCSTATLFSSSAHPLVGLIKKPSADWTETRSGLRSRHTSSTRWSIAAHLVKKFSVVPWFWQRQRETRAREREREGEREERGQRATGRGTTRS